MNIAASKWWVPAFPPSFLAFGTIGLVFAILSILVYLWFRFEWQFALGAMVANVHDIVLTIGFMSVTQIDFDLTSIAALLTILGYSLNDTVVIYDRIRENLRRYKRLPMADLLNSSVNSTLSRSIITHVTVTLALLALLLFGGHAIHSFTATMMFGVVLVGTYTSIFIAAPILIYLGVGTAANCGKTKTKADVAAAAQDGTKDRPHLPLRVPVEGYGKGGFRFGGMSHRGSLLCLPSGLWAWPVTRDSRNRRGGACPGVRGSERNRSVSAREWQRSLDHAGRAAGPFSRAQDQTSRWRAPARRSAPTISCSAKAAVSPRA